MQMSKNRPSPKHRCSKLRRSSFEGICPVRVFRLKPSIQNGVFLLFAKFQTKSRNCGGRATLSGPDWARTSDPALIKRML
jgi:hypothetical protein